MIGDIFNVGNRVTKVGTCLDNTKVLGIATVERRLKTKIVLDNGEEWCPDGTQPYRVGRWYRGPFLRPYKPGDEDLAKRTRAVRVLGGYSEWEGWSLEDLLVVADLIYKYRVKGLL